MPDRDDAARMMRLSMYTHAPGLNGRTACGIDQAWQIKSRDWGRVDCPECLGMETAGRPALTHHISEVRKDPHDHPVTVRDCGTHSGGSGSSWWPDVTCRECLALKPGGSWAPEESAGRPAQAFIVHYTGSTSLGVLCGITINPAEGILAANHIDFVTCPDCRHRHGAIAEESAGQPAESEAGMDITEREQLRRKWTVAAIGGDTELGFEDWLHEQSARPEPRLHTPPRMEDRRGLVDGVFIFYDAHPEEYFGENSLEVVPQSPSGNVEITVGNSLFTLHHSDRADLLRALLHDFHYSPEVGGPGDD